MVDDNVVPASTKEVKHNTTSIQEPTKKLLQSQPQVNDNDRKGLDMVEEVVPSSEKKNDVLKETIQYQ